MAILSLLNNYNVPKVHALRINVGDQSQSLSRNSIASTKEDQQDQDTNAAPEQSEEQNPDTNKDPAQSEDTASTNDSQPIANSTSKIHSPFPANWSNTDIRKAVKASIIGVDTVIHMGGKAASFVIQWYPVVINKMVEKNRKNKTESANSSETGKENEKSEDSSNNDKGMVEKVEIMLNNLMQVGKQGLGYIMIEDPNNNQSASTSDKDLNVGTDGDDQKQYMDSSEVNKMKSKTLTKESWRTALLVFCILSVLFCCFCAQWMAAVSKKSRLKLNKYYQRKKYEKDQLVQYISQAQIYRNYGDRTSLNERLSNDQREGRLSLDDDMQKNTIMHRSTSDQGLANASGGHRRGSSAEGGNKEHVSFKKNRKRDSYLSKNHQKKNDDFLQVLYDDEEKALLKFDDDGMLLTRPLFDASGLHEIAEERLQTSSSQNAQIQNL